jgi:hypothetical protein
VIVRFDAVGIEPFSQVDLASEGAGMALSERKAVALFASGR